MANEKSFDEFYEQAVKNYTGGGGAAAATTASVANFDFCSVWPTVRQGLEYLKGVVPLWAKIAIDALIGFGNAKCSG